MFDSKTRAVAAFVATLAWAGEITFTIANGMKLGVLDGIWSTLAFLTDWSGLLVAIVCSAVALNSSKLTSPIWRGVATVAITLVFLLYGILGGWARLRHHRFDSFASISDLLAHVATPIAMLFTWIFVFPRGGLSWRNAPRFTLFPVVYLIEMFGRGLLGGGYPYPEVNVPEVGWGGALAFSGVVTLLFFVLSLALVAADRLLSTSASRPNDMRLARPG